MRQKDIVSIKLRSGGVIKGFIESQDDNVVNMDVGFGKTVISKEQILVIETSTDEETKSWNESNVQLAPHELAKMKKQGEEGLFPKNGRIRGY